jgi:hypothetical protein
VSAQLSFIAMEKIIIHEVLRQNFAEEKNPPIYSEIECALNPEISTFLKDRITGSIGTSRAYDVDFIEGSDSPIPSLIPTLMGETNGTFVDLSKKIADHLNKIQSGRSPGGLLAILKATMGPQNLVGILKLEREAGAQLRQIVIDGKQTFDIEHLRNLILTENTRLFKIAVFCNEPCAIFPNAGKICDNQLSNGQVRQVADFYLKKFLGCDLSMDPRVETKRFFDSTQKFIQENVSDPLRQTNYNLHLTSYLSNQSKTISATKFAAASLESPDRHPYIQYLKANDVRTGNIPKNTSLIENKLKKMVLEFENGIKIVGDQDGFSKKVKLKKSAAGKTRAEIVARIKNVHT